MAVARLSIDDDDFLTGLRDDPDGTLWRYGFALSPEEMRDVREYFSSRSDDRNNEIVRRLRSDLDELADPSSRLAAASALERSRFWRL